MRLSERGDRAGMVQCHTSDEGILDVIFIERGDRNISLIGGRLGHNLVLVRRPYLLAVK